MDAARAHVDVLDRFIARRLEARDATHLRYRIRHRREHPAKTLKEES